MVWWKQGWKLQLWFMQLVGRFQLFVVMVSLVWLSSFRVEEWVVRLMFFSLRLRCCCNLLLIGLVSVVCRFGFSVSIVGRLWKCLIRVCSELVQRFSCLCICLFLVCSVCCCVWCFVQFMDSSRLLSSGSNSRNRCSGWDKDIGGLKWWWEVVMIVWCLVILCVV